MKEPWLSERQCEEVEQDLNERLAEVERDLRLNKSAPRRLRTMDFIENRKLYDAVMYARELMRDGYYPFEANIKAAEDYGFSTTEVAHYTGQVAGTIAGRNRRGKIEEEEE